MRDAYFVSVEGMDEDEIEFHMANLRTYGELYGQVTIEDVEDEFGGEINNLPGNIPIDTVLKDYDEEMVVSYDDILEEVVISVAGTNEKK